MQLSKDMQRHLLRLHLDPELMWIANESWRLHVERYKDESGHVRLKPLFIELGKAISYTIAERQGVRNDLSRLLTDNELCDIIMQWHDMNKNVGLYFDVVFNGVAEKIVELALARSVLPLEMYGANYWPEMEAWKILQN